MRADGLAPAVRIKLMFAVRLARTANPAIKLAGPPAAAPPMSGNMPRHVARRDECTCEPKARVHEERKVYGFTGSCTIGSGGGGSFGSCDKTLSHTSSLESVNRNRTGSHWNSGAIQISTLRFALGPRLRSIFSVITSVPSIRVVSNPSTTNE